MTTSRWGWLFGVMILESGRGKGTPLNSTCLTPKPLASSIYVHVPEAPSPRKQAISVISLFPSLVSVRHRSCMPAKASSRICAATCIGLTFRPPALACSASRLSRCRVASLIGTLGCRTQLPSVGLPGRRPCPGTRRAWMVWTIRASRGAERTPSGVGHLADHLRAEASGDFLNVSCHVPLTPFLAFPLLGRRGFFQRKSDLKVIVVNNQPRPEAVVLGRPPEGADYVRLPPLGAWSWSGPGFSQAPAEASPLMTTSRLIRCHARVLPSPDQNGKSTPDRSKLFGSHGQRPWF